MIVKIEKLTSSFYWKKIYRKSSEKRVIRVTTVVKMEKVNPSINARIFYIGTICTTPVTVSPKNKGHLFCPTGIVLAVGFLSG